MKTLNFLRHAKSDRDDTLRDHERPLAKRGLHACKVMAEHLKNSGFKVDRIYCSSSRRTRETYELLKPALDPAPITFRDNLYLIDPDELLEFIRKISDDASSALMIGHDPAFHMVASSLAKRAAPDRSNDLEALQEKFPTGALCRIQFDIAHWRDIAHGGGTLIEFTRPRDFD